MTNLVPAATLRRAILVEQGTRSPLSSTTLLLGAAGSPTEVDVTMGDSMPPGAAPAVDPQEAFLDEYVIERTLGAGGMGTVYLIRNIISDQCFALKRAFITDESRRRAFLHELETWIDLPDYPHLVACRFFRSFRGEVFIFAEYVAGGTLSSWIREHRITSLDHALGLAIQFAWGLHAAHACGVVHQDVKPGNVLLTAGGTLKVTDFGLARLRSNREPSAVAQPGPEGAHLISCAGMTAAYASPEQARGERLGVETDIWSYGVSLLEIFTGRVTWLSGTAAAQVLDAFVSGAQTGGQPFVMPPGVADVLRRCFAPDPAQRWQSMLDLVGALQAVHAEATGRPYADAIPPLRRAPAVTIERKTAGGATWDDPGRWLTEARREAGVSPAALEPQPAPRPTSRTAQAVADIAAYWEAAWIFDALISEGRTDLEERQARLLGNLAFVYHGTKDMAGALATYERAITLWEQLVDGRGRSDLAVPLAMAYLDLALARYDLDDQLSSISLCDRCIAVCERVRSKAEQTEAAHILARACMNKAHALKGPVGNRVRRASLLRPLGALDTEACQASALECSRRSVVIYEDLVERQGRTDLTSALAAACLTFADALEDHGDRTEAAKLVDRAIALYESLSDRTSDLVRNLAIIYERKAILLENSSQLSLAASWYGRAISLYEDLVYRQGRSDLADELASIYVACADTAPNDETRSALLERAIPLMEDLIYHRGRSELILDLTRVYLSIAALTGQGDPTAVPGVHDKGAKLCERLIWLTGQSELVDEFATFYLKHADILQERGDPVGSARLYDRAIALWRSYVSDLSKNGTGDGLASADANRSNTLKILKGLGAALESMDRVIEIWQSLINQGGQSHLIPQLSNACLIKGDALAAMRQNAAALEWIRKGITTLEQLATHEGRTDLLETLIHAYSRSAFMLRLQDDLPGAVTEHNKAISILENLLGKQGRVDVSHDLAVVYVEEAAVWRKMGKLTVAVDLYGAATALLEDLVHRRGRVDLEDSLVSAYLDQAATLRELSNEPRVLEAYDKVLVILERQVFQQGRMELADSLCLIYLSRIHSLQCMRDLVAVKESLPKAIALCEERRARGGGPELEVTLQRFYRSKGYIHFRERDLVTAAELFDRAIGMLQQQVMREGRDDLAYELASAYTKRAAVYKEQGHPIYAVELNQQAIHILLRLIDNQSSTELLSQLADAYLNQADAVHATGDGSPTELMDKAISIGERLVLQDGKFDLVDALVGPYIGKASMLSEKGDPTASLELYEKALAIWERRDFPGKRTTPELVSLTLQMLRLSLLDRLGRAEPTAVHKLVVSLEDAVYRMNREDLKHLLALTRKRFGRGGPNPRHPSKSLWGRLASWLRS